MGPTRSGRSPALAILALMMGVLLGTGPAPAVADAASHQRIAEAITPSLVRIEFTLRYDRGDAPEAMGWRYKCPNCGNWHRETGRGYAEDDRPLQRSGIVLSATRVVTSDPIIHPRFVERIVVRAGDEAIEATAAAWGRTDKAMFLELQQPLPEDYRPVPIEPDAEGPYFAVTYGVDDGGWILGISPLPEAMALADDGRAVSPGVPGSVIVSAEGRAVAVCMRDELPLDGSWKGSPDDWPVISREQLQQRLEQIEALAGRALVHVALSFRSRATPATQRFRHDDEEDAAERSVLGVLVGPQTVLALVDLPARTTATLERIRVSAPSGPSATGSFLATLKDYGALMIELDEPLEAAVRLYPHDARQLRHELLLVANVSLRGEQRIAYFGTGRIAGYGIGRRGMVFPEIPRDHDTELFVFTMNGELAVMPVSFREPFEDPHHHWRSGRAAMVPVAHLQPVFDEPLAHADKNNVPLSEEDENRLAWLGVETQALDARLARLHGVSDQTRDGQTGMMIAYVYPNSPAAEAGLQSGDILLRLHPKGRSRPVELRHQDVGMYMEHFPWDRIDEVPEQFFEQIPMPWPSMNNSLNQALTQLGFGNRFTAEVVRDGETLRIEFKVVQSPPHYDSAARFRSERLGLTVRDVTYELRRYFQMDAEAPGVIVSRLEPGGKASVGGVKPYEIITHVNDEPAKNVERFQQLVEQHEGELHLSVQRMHQGRIVKLAP